MNMNLANPRHFFAFLAVCMTLFIGPAAIGVKFTQIIHEQEKWNTQQLSTYVPESLGLLQCEITPLDQGKHTYSVRGHTSGLPTSSVGEAVTVLYPPGFAYVTKSTTSLYGATAFHGRGGRANMVLGSEIVNSCLTAAKLLKG